MLIDKLAQKQSHLLGEEVINILKNKILKEGWTDTEREGGTLKCAKVWTVNIKDFFVFIGTQFKDFFFSSKKHLICKIEKFKKDWGIINFMKYIGT